MKKVGKTTRPFRYDLNPLIYVRLPGLPPCSPVEHVLSELSTMTRPSWVALHGMAYSFIQLDKAVVHVYYDYDYIVEVRNTFKGLDLIDRVPE